MENISNSMRDDLITCLSKQLSELELFQSMYPNTDELLLTNTKVLDDINLFIHRDTEYTPPHLDFVLNVFVNKLKLEICINLPSFYPNEEPNVRVRCNQLNRQQETQLNYDLTKYIKDIPLGDTCLYTIVSWIQENAGIIEADTIPHKIAVQQNFKSVDNFSRYWIYSHHIYNKKKREDIVYNAKCLHLNGFCLPGKPGVICIEGDESNCKEWWRIIKSMCWKKIILRQIELYDASERTEKQKFENFEEIHMNMSSFSKYIEELGLSDSFNGVFGICHDLSTSKHSSQGDEGK